MRPSVNVTFAIRVGALLMAVAAVGTCGFVMFARFRYPYDLEWMTGSELDHIDRIRHGLPVYVAPSSDWIPFMYPPLYYHVAAWMTWLIHDVRSSARLVSVLSTGGVVLLVWHLARKHRANRTWSAIAVGLFAAAFPITQCWYDIERPDSLLTLLVLGALALLLRGSALVAALAGLLLGAAFFVKQPAALFALAATVALVARHAWRQLGAFVATVACVMYAGVVYEDRLTNGWFTYYCIRMPRAHGVRLDLVPQLLGDFAHAWLYVLVTLLAFVLFAMRWRTLRPYALGVGFLAAAFASSCGSRLHIGGWPNVLMYWLTSASIAVGVLASAVERYAEPSATEWTSRVAFGCVILQCFGLRYDPTSQIPGKEASDRMAAFVKDVRSLEVRGEVLALGMGHVTERPHFHDAAFFDVLYVEKRVPVTIVDDVHSARFAAIILVNFDDLWLPYEPAVGDSFFRAVAARYFVARKLDSRIPSPPTGIGFRPTWVLQPRETPLDEHMDLEALLRQHLAEISIATAREEASRRDVLHENPDSTEVLGTALVKMLYR